MVPESLTANPNKKKQKKKKKKKKKISPQIDDTS